MGGGRGLCCRLAAAFCGSKTVDGEVVGGPDATTEPHTSRNVMIAVTRAVAARHISDLGTRRAPVRWTNKQQVLVLLFLLEETRAVTSSPSVRRR